MAESVTEFGKDYYAERYYTNVPFDPNIVLDYQSHWARLSPLFRLDPRSRVLDAGCGLGYWSMELAKHFPGLEAFDISPQAVASVQRRLPNHKISVGDIERIDAPDATYDGAFAFEILEHLEDSRVGLGELKRVLKPGGRLVLLQEYRGDDYAKVIRKVGDVLDSLGVRRRKVPRHADRKDLHRSARSPWGWQRLLAAEGFAVEHRIVLSVLPTLLNPVWPAFRRRFFDMPVVTPIDRALCRLPGAAWFGIGCMFIATKKDGAAAP
jgi:SAM-dependent methyltransferase